MKPQTKSWLLLIVVSVILFGAVTFTIVRQYLVIQELKEELRWEKAKLRIIHQDPRFKDIMESGG